MLCAEPLEPHLFARYGRLVAPEGAHRPANDGRAQRFDRLASIEHAPEAARLEVAIYRIAPSRSPLEVRYLERHPLSSHLFMPLGSCRYLVAVAPSRADGSPDEARLAAFVGGAGVGVCYGPGVWHYPLVALDAAADFLMLMWQADDARDCETRVLGEPRQISC